MPEAKNTDEFELYDLKVSIEAINGTCTCDHAIADYFELKGGKLHLPAGQSFCLFALQAAIPLLPAKQRPTACTASCIKGHCASCRNSCARVTIGACHPLESAANRRSPPASDFVLATPVGGGGEDHSCRLAGESYQRQHGSDRVRSAPKA